MLKQITGKQIKQLSTEKFEAVRRKFAQVAVDLGTGDGKFAYEYAKAHPDIFVIGIDADKSQAEDVSYKASRKPAKGGLENVIFLWAKAEELPIELSGVADEIYVNFPWGSLLAGVIIPENLVLTQIKTIAKPGAALHIYVSYDAKFEEEKIGELDLPELSLDYLQNELTKKYKESGIMIQESRKLNKDESKNLISSWPKRILSKRERDVYYIQAAIQTDHVDHVDNMVHINQHDRSGISDGYSFYVHGHPNILATHPKTLEFTKDSDLTERGDCIIGISAEFELEKLKSFSGKIRVVCEIGDLKSEFKCKVHPGFVSDHELVLRKSGFASERTFGIGLNKGANHLDREMVKLLQNPETKMKVTIAAA